MRTQSTPRVSRLFPSVWLTLSVMTGITHLLSCRDTGGGVTAANWMRACEELTTRDPERGTICMRGISIGRDCMSDVLSGSVSQSREAQAQAMRQCALRICSQETQPVDLLETVAHVSHPLITARRQPQLQNDCSRGVEICLEHRDICRAF